MDIPGFFILAQTGTDVDGPVVTWAGRVPHPFCSATYEQMANVPMTAMPIVPDSQMPRYSVRALPVAR